MTIASGRAGDRNSSVKGAAAPSIAKIEEESRVCVPEFSILAILAILAMS
jgi:hypothetical protein